MRNRELAIVLGTRPEIIKMSSMIRECERLGLDYFILHTRQHYTYNLDKVFFEQLELSEAKHNLDVGSGSHAEQTGKMRRGIEKILQKETPDVVLIEGDTNTVLAGALAATKLHISPYRACGVMGQSPIKVGHVEAGLRSYDRRMPEEINRVLTDHCSDYLFAPTEKARRILLSEGISDNKIFVTGNTVVDAVYQNLSISEERINPLNGLELVPKRYFLVTAHRQGNVDVKARFEGIIKGLELVATLFLFRKKKTCAKRKTIWKYFWSWFLPKVKKLFGKAFFLKERFVLTDSGGVQEEACILGVPCVTLRDNTERPETLEVGSNILVGTESEKIFRGVKKMLSRNNDWENPFGDGRAGERIVKILEGVE